MEIKTIVNDYRIQKRGGLNTGILPWEVAVIPMLLNNAGTWNNINEKSIRKLNNLQNLLIRNIFATPRSTPTPALCWDTGLLTMQHKIELKQLNLLYHIRKLKDNNLAKEVSNVQSKYKFPGLIGNLRRVTIRLELPNIIDRPT